MITTARVRRGARPNRASATDVAARTATTKTGRNRVDSRSHDWNGVSSRSIAPAASRSDIIQNPSP